MSNSFLGQGFGLSSIGLTKAAADTFVLSRWRSAFETIYIESF